MQWTNLKKYQRMSVNINCLVQIWLDFMTMTNDFHWNQPDTKKRDLREWDRWQWWCRRQLRQHQLFLSPRDWKVPSRSFNFLDTLPMPPLHSKDFSSSLNHLKDILTQPRYTSWFIIPLLFVELILNVIIINYVKCEFCF